MPVADRYDRDDRFPAPLVARMRELGLFGLTIPRRYGGMELDLSTYAQVVEELSRGWITVSGLVNTHLVGAYLLRRFGTEEQRRRYLPRMATGEVRAAFALSEPDCGSDVQGIRTTAQWHGQDGWSITGRKMWLTSGLRAGLVFLLARTDPTASPPHSGMSCLIVEKEPGVAEPGNGISVARKIAKMGYRGVETTEVAFDGCRCRAGAVLGGDEQGLGAGFRQVMSALELGRVNVAARGVGVAQRALELALDHVTAGSPEQGEQFRLADMATRVEASRLLTQRAAAMADAGERSDTEAGMAKLFACETAHYVVEQALRMHGLDSLRAGRELERLYRDAPLLLVGEGTSEIQRLVIAGGLLRRAR